MIKTLGYAAYSAHESLKKFEFELRDVGENDLLIDVLYCGVCHSDIHFARNEWQETIYPIVPGHEIIGRVTETGKKVTQFKVDEIVAVGCIVDACEQCDHCKKGLQQYCQKGYTLTFNSFDKHTGGVTYGGYAKAMVVDAQYVFKIPEQLLKMDLARLAPLLCAGITTYSPLRHWNIGKGQKVGIAGIGGLGHLAVKFAHAIGAEVFELTTSQNKREDAQRLGAQKAILSTDPEQMKQHFNSFDFILSTVPFAHDLNPYLSLLKLDGTMCLVGIPSQPHPYLRADILIEQRRSLAGSLIGGIPQTKEMLEFCAQNNVAADVEIIPIQKVNEAFERIIKKDIQYRFVIDMTSL